MSFLVILVVDDIDRCSSILDAWEQAGAPGITILDSTGLGHIRKAWLRDDFPLLPSLSDLLDKEEVRHRTLFSVVPDQEMVDRLISVTERVLGDLDEPDTGFLFVLPIVQAVGLQKRHYPNQ